jgi:exonuclease I
VRTAYALRPDGIQWPRNEEGKVSFRLEHLTAANGLSQKPRMMLYPMCARRLRWRVC